MGVLLGLGDVQLADAVGGEHLGQHVGEILARERDRRNDVVGVLGHLHVVRKRRVGATVEAVELALGERPRQLAGPVRPEVEEDGGVAGPDPPARRIADHDRLDELIRHAEGVARLDRLDGVAGPRADSVDDRVVGPLRPLPAAVAVHRVVPAGHRRDAGDPVEIPLRAVRRGVAPVGEGVHVHALDALPARELDERLEVANVAVNAAV